MLHKQSPRTIESIDLRYLPALVIASQKSHAVGIPGARSMSARHEARKDPCSPCLQRHKQRERLQAIVSAVYKVSLHEVSFKGSNVCCPYSP